MTNALIATVVHSTGCPVGTNFQLIVSDFQLCLFAELSSRTQRRRRSRNGARSWRRPTTPNTTTPSSCLLTGTSVMKLFWFLVIEEHILDSNAGKQLSQAATGVLVTLVLKKWRTLKYRLKLWPPVTIVIKPFTAVTYDLWNIIS